jgi:hypothetical protein
VLATDRRAIRPTSNPATIPERGCHSLAEYLEVKAIGGWGEIDARTENLLRAWIPAFAGMTSLVGGRSLQTHVTPAKAGV